VPAGGRGRHPPAPARRGRGGRRGLGAEDRGRLGAARVRGSRRHGPRQDRTSPPRPGPGANPGTLRRHRPGGNAVPLRGAPRRRHAGGRRPGPPDTGTSPLRLPGRLRTRERTSRRALPTGPRRPPLVPVRLGPGPGGLESFRVDRMSAVQPTGMRFQRREDAPDAATFVAEGLAVGVYSYRARVVLHCPIDEARRLVSPTAAVLEEDGDRTLMRIGADDLDWIARYLAGMPVR